MKHTIQLNEDDIRSMIEQAICKYYIVNEGRLGKTLGTAALGGMLALGNMANAKNADIVPAHTQTTVMQTNPQTIDFSNLIESNVTISPNKDEMTGSYQLIYRVNMDSKTMLERLVGENEVAQLNKYQNDSTLSKTMLNNMERASRYKISMVSNRFDANDCSIDIGDGMYKITYNGQFRQTNDAVFTIYIKDGVFKIVVNFNNRDSTMKMLKRDHFKSCVKLWMEDWPKTDISAIAQLIVHSPQNNSKPQKEIDIRSEFDFE